MIAENSYLIPDSEKEKYAQRNKYLLIVTDLEEEMEQNADEITLQLEFVKKGIFKKMKKLKQQIKKSSSIIKQNEERF